MDYFDSNFKNDQEDQQSDLPEGFGWDDMSAGIYEKMPAPKKNNRYWPLLLLLFVVGCGGGSWYAVNYLTGENSTISKDTEFEKSKKEINTAQQLSEAAATEIPKTSTNNSSAQASAQNNLNSPKSNDIDNHKTFKSSATTTTIKSKVQQITSQKTVVNNKQPIQNESPSIANSSDATVPTQKQESTAEVADNKITDSVQGLNSILELPAIPYGLIDHQLADFPMVKKMLTQLGLLADCNSHFKGKIND